MLGFLLGEFSLKGLFCDLHLSALCWYICRCPSNWKGNRCDERNRMPIFRTDDSPYNNYSVSLLVLEVNFKNYISLWLWIWSCLLTLASSWRFSLCLHYRSCYKFVACRCNIILQYYSNSPHWRYIWHLTQPLAIFELLYFQWFTKYCVVC